MGSSKFVFVGIRGTAVALDRETGEMLWETHLNGDEYVHLVLDGNYLYASTHGEIFCLEPMTGRVRWGNPMKGYGYGVASIATRGTSGRADLHAATEEADKRRKGAAAADTIFIS